MSNMKNNLDKYLGDYLDLGYAIHEFELEPLKVIVKIKTITLEEQLALEADMKLVSLDEVPIYRMHQYQINYLSKTLLKFGTVEFSTCEEAKQFLIKRGTAIGDKIMAEQSELEKLFRGGLKEEDIENFTKPLSTVIEQN
jgi:hypothetical protein